MMQMICSIAEFDREMSQERTSAGVVAARAEGQTRGRRKQPDAAKRHEIAESVSTGCRSRADMALLYNIRQLPCRGSSPNIRHRMAQP
jgi:DNA invertase Pin-like site-specific DNA recombinase